MNGHAFLERAAELDAEIMALDRRRLIARVNHAPRKTLLRMDTRRDQLVRDWGAAWQTKRVSP